MEWVERHQVLITLLLMVVSYLVQALYVRWRVGLLLEWQKEVNSKLTSIDAEVNGVKISDAREGQKTETMASEIKEIKGEMTQMKGRLDDVYHMLMVALAEGKLGDRRINN